MTNGTPENQEPEVSRTSTSRRRALKAGAGAVLVPTIMTITARSAHAADYTTTAYRYGVLMGCMKVMVPQDWTNDPDLPGEFTRLRPGDNLAGFAFQHGVYFTDGMGFFFVLVGGVKRPINADDWAPV